ncbi:MAG: hypothetical protein QOF76_266 [Solirubrobacteraceae bacterium]|nr:hypothetical protein [Solirubrobacteraceae bacterium]
MTSRGQRGQATLLIVGGLFGLLLGAFILGAVAKGLGERAGAQRTADLASLAGARAMLDAYPRLFEPAVIDGQPNPTHLERAAYLELARAAALDVAGRNGDLEAQVGFPDGDALAPTRIQVTIRRTVTVQRGRAHASAPVEASAEARLVPEALSLGPGAAGGEYGGPFAIRQGQKLRPDVAEAFDRMNAAASADGVQLLITSAWRSDAEQAVLFAAHPDPKWVAPPGTSLHRYGTELDLGPPSAYGWLDAHGGEFHFVQRYAWEDWHWGYTLNAASSGRTDADGAVADHAAGHPAVPGFVPEQYADVIARAAQRYNVSAILLSAQLYAESGFNPNAVSPAGAQGIAQFMPGTAAGMGLGNPFDATAAIDAQARLMRGLLQQFASVQLALAAYNAGPARVSPCMCVPAIGETQAYVAQILGLMNGAGDASGGGLSIRLVR